jgi:hypothetical protein
MSNIATKPLDAFAAGAFALAFLLMVVPVEADIAFVLMNSGRYTQAVAFASTCFVAVLAPVCYSWRRQRSQPGIWRGRGYLIAAIGILVVNALMTFATVMHNISK